MITGRNPRAALSIINRLPTAPACAMNERLRAQALRQLGNLAESTACLLRAKTAAEAQGHRSLLWRIYIDLASVYHVAGERKGAREAASQAMELVESLARDIPDDAVRESFRQKALSLLPSTLRPRRRRPALGGLSHREVEVVAFVAQGLSNRAIAEELVLSARTVETHIANAMAKLGHSSRAQLAAWAGEQGLNQVP
jgi:DNA-binding CsgD family transcriptional regulator